MKTTLFVLTILFSTQAFALNFAGVFWSKKNCRSLSNECIPQRTSTLVHYEIEDPEPNSAKRMKIQGSEYDVWIYYNYKTEPQPYKMFQVELIDKNGKTLGLCSRYESVDTFENVPVGACAGTIEDRVVGFSVMLPTN
ncbi:MAG: hypothetical protein KC493_08770 [Bacteriovoracaceae bacterium]|nr:hypothetical protein [Bacteriovoracaceae bacterium]